MTEERDTHPIEPSVPADGPWLRLTQYLVGDLGAADRSEVERWINSDVRRAELVSQMQRIWSEPDSAASLNVDAALAVIERQLGLHQKPSAIRAKGSKSKTGEHSVAARFFRKRSFRRTIATAVIGVAGVIGVIVLSGRTPLVQSPIAVRTYSTAPGQRATVTLADGSQVALGSSTTVTASVAATRGARSLAVVGEAVVTVAHSAERPFTVRVGTTTARVIGTTFLIRQYRDESVARVAVANGRVSVRNTAGGSDTRDVILSAGMLGIVGDSTPVQVIPVVAMEDYTSLVTGRLVFHNARVGDIVREMERAYGASIGVLDSALANQRVTFTLPVAKWSLTEAIDVLADALDARYTQSGDTLKLTPQRGNAPRTPSPIAVPLPSSSDTHYGR